MHLTPQSARAACSLAGLLLLAACGGVQSSLPSQARGLLPSQGAGTRIAQSDAAGDVCKRTGSVQVIPCHVKLKPSKMTVVTVSDTNPSITITSKETDDCNGIATFKFTNFYGQWDVTAGSAAGKCTAVFTGYNTKGKKVGTATLHVTVT